MQVLQRTYDVADIGHVGAETMRGALLATDSPVIAAWGRAHGLLPVGTLADPHALEAAFEAGADCVVWAMGFERDLDGLDFEDVLRTAEQALAAVQTLLKMRRRISLIGLRRQTALAACVMDGIGLSAVEETNRLTYASLTLRGEPDAALAPALVAVRAAPGVRHLFDGRTLRRERLHPLGAQPAGGLEFAAGAQVVLGGAGGIGSQLCRHLSDSGAGPVCVIGRSPLSEAIKARLKVAGARLYLQADAADSESLAAALAHVRTRFGVLGAVYNLAGALGDKLVVNRAPGEMRAVLAPKIASALNLWRSAPALRPGLVCNFTSLSGLLGNMGQADYAAANGFVDALSSHADAAGDGTSWRAIAWGLWDGSGMAMPGGQAGGLLAMTPEQGFGALRRVIAQPTPLCAAFAGPPDLLGVLAPAPPHAASTDADPALTKALAHWIMEAAHRLSRLPGLTVEDTLPERGVDSATLINIVSVVERHLAAAQAGLRLRKAVIFDHPSPRLLAAHLVQIHSEAVRLAMGNVGAGPDAAPAASLSATTQASAEFEQAEAPHTEEGSTLNDRAQEWLTALVRRFTGLLSIDPEASLLQSGLDSVASINLAGEIARALSGYAPTRISKALVFEHPTIAEIAGMLLTQHGAAFRPFLADRAPAQPAPDRSRSALAQLRAGAVPTIAALPHRAAAQPLQSATSAPPEVAIRPEDIAIIGLAGEFPGADTVEDLWTLLLSDTDAITVVPAARWAWREGFSPDTKARASSYGRHGGFLPRAKQFDPAFFGITPIEAARIDPQERRLLQTAYQALEDSGHFAQPDEDTGVFTAAMFGHYQDLAAEGGAISTSFASIANRISFFFNLQGPSLAVDSMCSGALTALHLAISSIKAGECRQALVGAVNIMPHAGKLQLLSAGHFLSPSGRCHSFGIEADGYVPGEGAIAVVLKPLVAALRDGDRTLAVIRGSAINAGGRASGFTVPSARAQADVIRRAIDQAAINPTEVDYIEAHGTGTRLGDPIEISGLAAAYGKREGPARVIGAIKSSIGHLESAAGLAGLAKVVLQFRHGSIAPTRNCAIENPYLDLEAHGFRLPRKAEPWDKPDRLAGLSSFGAGGSNAHVILRSPPAYVPRVPALPFAVIPISGRTPSALAARLDALADWLARTPDAELYGIGYTLALCREHFRHRTCLVVRSLGELTSGLANLRSGAASGGQAPEGSLASRLARDYNDGETPDFRALYPVKSLVSLPHYVFDDREYWALESAPARDAAGSNQQQLETPPPSDLACTDQEAQDALLTFHPVWRPAPDPAQKPTSGSCFVLCGPEWQAALIGQPDLVTFSPEEGPHALNQSSSGTDSEPVIIVNLVDDAAPGPAETSLIAAQFALAKALANSGRSCRLAYVHSPQSSIQEPAWPPAIGSALAASFRVLAIETPGLAVLDLEVDAAAMRDPPSLVAAARRELAAMDGTYLACRHQGNVRAIAGLEEFTLPPPARAKFRQRGVYLVTGGLGMIGLAVARRLLEKFDAAVVLVGRTPSSAATDSKLDALRGLGGRASYRSVDLCNADAVDALVRATLAEHGSLHGVINAAGVLADSLMRTKTEASFTKVLRVKVCSARNLDEATATLRLDFFVLFSSIASLFANVGQADYAAGNRYLDLFAAARQERVARGTRHGLSLSLNWPLWIDDTEATASMSGYRALADYLEVNFGIGAFGLGRGVDALLRLIEAAPHETPQIAPFVGDAAKLRCSVAERRLDAPAPTSMRVQPSGTPRPSDTLAAATPDQMVSHLRALVRVLTGLADEDFLDQSGFGDLGFTSVMLQDLVARVASLYGVSIPPSALFTHTNIAALAAHLCEAGARLPGAAPPGSTLPAAGGVATGLPGRGPTVMSGRLARTEAPDRRVAIIGMDGRLPGGPDLAGFWAGLMAGRSAIGRIERWTHARHFGGTINGIDQFDAKFFGLSAREAMLMDPQHRLFLQASYNAMLDAGRPPGTLGRTAVFAGVQFTDYQTLLQASGSGNHPYAATGNAHAMLANRVSFMFDFHGPSQTIDTACSSALVAVNRAMLALAAGECDHALAGAVSLLIDSAMTDAARSMGVLSPQHRCATFDAEADGYVRAEGVGCLVLKRLEDATRDGDPVHAIIEAAAENHGGRASSLTAPNPLAQRDLLLRAYTPELARRVSYIEAHGTGTKLGDPIEIDALKSAWRSLHPEAAEGSILLGSVKSQIGHLEPAAGIASLIKVILALRHRSLPSNAHFSRLNPYIDLAGSPFAVLDRPTPWLGASRVAGISSFGFGGANAHVVLSEAQARPPSPAAQDGKRLVVLSAKSATSLLRMASDLAEWLEGEDARAHALADIAATLGEGREHFDHRLAWVVSDLPSLGASLRATRAEQIVHLAKAEVRGAPARTTSPEAAREGYLAGLTPDWAALQGGPRQRVHLPGYAFDTRSYWFEDSRETVLVDS